MSIQFLLLMVSLLRFTIGSRQEGNFAGIMQFQASSSSSAMSSLEKVMLEKTDQEVAECEPSSAKKQCKYDVIKSVDTGYFGGKKHKKARTGLRGADELLVTKEGPGKQEFVWKRLASGAKALSETVKKWECSKGHNILLPVDTNPKVHIDKLFGPLAKQNYDGDGLIFNKMDGALSREKPPAEECFPKFFRQMVGALQCIRTNGYQHTDVTLKHILFKKESTDDPCPEYYLADFELLTKIGEEPRDPKSTLDLKKEVLRGKYADQAKSDWERDLGAHFEMRGHEDIIMLANEYAKFVDNSVNAEELCRFHHVAYLCAKPTTFSFFPTRPPKPDAPSYFCTQLEEPEAWESYLPQLGKSGPPPLQLPNEQPVVAKANCRWRTNGKLREMTAGVQTLQDREK